MVNLIQQLREVVREPACLADIGYIFGHFINITGVQNASYMAFNLGGGAKNLRNEIGQLAGTVGTWRQQPGQVAATTYTPSWIQRYAEMKYVRLDPAVVALSQSFLPVSWQELDWSDRKKRAFRQESIEFGVGNQGYTIPIRGPGGHIAILSVSGRKTDREWELWINRWHLDVLLFSHYIHQKVLELTNFYVGRIARRLSPREIAVLSGLAGGKNRANVAEELSIAESTLRIYADSARSKLGAANLSHAIALGIREGYI